MGEVWVIWRGKVCIMVFDVRKKRHVYIPERKWLRMSVTERSERYV